MINHNHRTLLVLALAATFVGAAVAQTTSDDKSRMPANKGMPQAQQTQPADQPTDKMKGQTDAQAPASDQTGKKTATEKSAKPAKQASKAHSQPTAAAEPGEKAFRQALRECAKQQDQSQRDSCLDNAIEQFQRG
jgi:hypothetical protein